MGLEVVNKNKNCIFNSPYVGRDLYITMFQESEREFVVTHNANIKPVAYFIGRETELQELRQRMEVGQKSVLVSGMGGIGKTHICRKLFEEYLNKHAENESGSFRHIGYIEYNGDMGNSLQSCLKFKQQDRPEQNQEAAWKELEYLAADGKLLLFVDNVDKPVSADSGLQKLKEIPGTIVLTSRQASFCDEFEPYRIGFLDMGQCMELYERIRFGGSERKVEPEEVHDLEYVIECLAGRHTITVELLAYLTRTKLWPVKRLREELKQKGFRLEFHKDGGLINIQESYEVLYDLSVLTEAEQNILEAFSVFPYIPLSAEKCNEWLLADAGASEENDILMGLYQKGWLQYDMELESFSMHPVFSQFINKKYMPRSEEHCGLIEMCQKSLKVLERSSVLERRKFVPFVEGIVDKMIIGKDEEQIRLLFCFGCSLGDLAEYEKAERLFKECLDLGKEILGEEHPAIAAIYFNLAAANANEGKYKKAERYYIKCIQIEKTLFGKEDSKTALSYVSLAAVYEDQGKFEKAEDIYKKGLQIRRKVLGEEHHDTVGCYKKLGHLYAAQGKYKKAEEMYVKGIQIEENVLEECADKIMNYIELAYVFEMQKEYEKAEGLYKKILQLSEKCHEEEKMDTGVYYYNLAKVYMYQENYDKAKELCIKSLEITEKVLGKNHPNIASAYHDLAQIFTEQGNYEKAEESYYKSLQIFKATHGEGHPYIAIIYYNLANMYDNQRKYEVALEYYIKAYKIFLIFKINHLYTKITYEDMKTAYQEWNPDSNFEQWLRENIKESE